METKESNLCKFTESCLLRVQVHRRTHGHNVTDRRVDGTREDL